MMKVCKTCKIEKNVSEFNKDTRAKGKRSSRGGMGVQPRCRPCMADARKPGIVAARKRAAARLARGVKECSVCERVLPVSGFSVRKASPDGLGYKCRECNAEYLTQWRTENPDAFAEWSAENVEERRASTKAWREANSEVRAEYMAQWAKDNAAGVNARVAKRMARKIDATPEWADDEKMAAIYAEASRITAETGVRHEVDHYFPLQGETICGLHCEANLQILTKVENIRKLNRMPECASVWS